jgi:hypothetical protein
LSLRPHVFATSLTAEPTVKTHRMELSYKLDLSNEENLDN